VRTFQRLIGSSVCWIGLKYELEKNMGVGKMKVDELYMENLFEYVFDDNRYVSYC
jgi:hypothetical protein